MRTISILSSDDNVVHGQSFEAKQKVQKKYQESKTLLILGRVVNDLVMPILM